MVEMTGYRRGLRQADPNKYWSPSTAAGTSFQNFQGANQTALGNDYTAQVLPQYDWALKAAQAGGRSAELTWQSAMNQANNAAAQHQANWEAQQQANQDAIDQAAQQAGNVPQPQQPNVPLNPKQRAIMRALGQEESGGDFSSREGGLGKLGVARSNIKGPGGWDVEVLGRNIAPKEFLTNKRLQKRIVKSKFEDLVNELGTRGALRSWYRQAPRDDYASARDYVQQIMARYRAMQNPWTDPTQVPQ